MATPSFRSQRTPTALKDLSPDIWRSIGERVGLAPLLRLWLCGCKDLALSVQRVYYRRLYLSFHNLLWSECSDMAELAHKLSICLQFQADEITFYHAAPELLYMAAHILLPRQSRTSLANLYKFEGRQLDRAQLESIPWLRLWKSTYKLILVRARSFDTGSCLGDFAMPKSICVHKHRSALAISRDDMDPTFDFGFQLPITLTGLEEIRYNTAFLQCTTQLDLTSLPSSVKSCSVTFSIDSRLTTRLMVSASSTLHKLVIRNLKSEFTPHDSYYPVTVRTERLAQLKKFFATGVLWSQYIRDHNPENATCLTDIRLRHCSLGNNAWTLTWPPHLLFLSIVECIGGTGLYRLLDPLKLPLYLETLIVKGGCLGDLDRLQPGEIQHFAEIGHKLPPKLVINPHIQPRDLSNPPLELYAWSMACVLFTAETLRFSLLPHIFLRTVIIEPSLVSSCAKEFLPASISFSSPKPSSLPSTPCQKLTNPLEGTPMPD